MKEALPLVKPLLDLDGDVPMYFCTEEKMQQRRGMADLLAAERDLRGQGYSFNWCVAALEAEGGNIDEAREWLRNWAPVQAA